MDDLARLIAQQEIQQLAHRYAVAMDARDLDALVALFVPDVQVGREERGHAALRASFDRQLRSVGITFLQVGTHTLELADDENATGIVYCRAEIQDGVRWIVQAIQYHDTYARRDGHWYFARRRHLLVYGAELGQNPLTLPPADWPASHTGRGTLPESLPSWKRFWGEEPE
jgi:ketosteroid isomerase-like protein